MKNKFKVGDMIRISPNCFISELKICNNQLARIIEINDFGYRVIPIGKQQKIFIFKFAKSHYLTLGRSDIEYIGDFKKYPDSLDEILDI